MTLRPSPGPGREPATPPAPGTPSENEPQTGTGARTAVLVGYGVKADQVPQRRPRRTPHGVDHVEPGPPGETARPVRHGGLELGRAVEGRLGAQSVRAKPPVRRLARDLDVDLAQVVPTGPDGTITHDDVASAAGVARAAGAARRPGTRSDARASRCGGRSTARSGRHRGRAADACRADDVPRDDGLGVHCRARDRVGRRRCHGDDLHDPHGAGARGRRRTVDHPLTFAALGLVRAAREHPTINASLDATGENLLVHRSVHLGIAVDSPRGLVVLADQGGRRTLDLPGMGDALARLVETARSGRSRPEDLRGSTMTITNVGRLRRRWWDADPQPGRGCHPGPGARPAPAVGRGRPGRGPRRR